MSNEQISSLHMFHNHSPVDNLNNGFVIRPTASKNCPLSNAAFHSSLFLGSTLFFKSCPAKTNARISKDQFNILRPMTHSNNGILAMVTPKHLSPCSLFLCFVFAFGSGNLVFLN